MVEFLTSREQTESKGPWTAFNVNEGNLLVLDIFS